MAQVESDKVVARRTSGVSRRGIGRWGERIGVLLIALGIAGLIQPFHLQLFTSGFSVLLAGTLLFIITSHL